MARPKIRTDEELRETTSARRARFDDKRQKSGLKAVTIYVDTSTLEAITKLSKEFGYCGSKTREENRSEVRSNIIGYCVKEMAGLEAPSYFGSRDTLAIAQQIYRLQQIIEYRRTLNKGSTPSLLKFLRDIEQPNVDQIVSDPMKLGINWRRDEFKRGTWNEDELKYALNSKKLSDLMTSVATSKKKLSKP